MYMSGAQISSLSPANTVRIERKESIIALPVVSMSKRGTKILLINTACENRRSSQKDRTNKERDEGGKALTQISE